MEGRTINYKPQSLKSEPQSLKSEPQSLKSEPEALKIPIPKTTYSPQRRSLIWQSRFHDLAPETQDVFTNTANRIVPHHKVNNKNKKHTVHR